MATIDRQITTIQNTRENIDWDGLPWQERQFTNQNKTIRLATSFSGIGAIEYAFKRLGLKSRIVFAGDINSNCKKTYFANYNIKEENWHTDIHEFSAKPFKGEVDLLVGGAPCQAFSTVGDQLGFEDTRGTLFREFARLVKECMPKVFIFENVQGLFKHDNGNTWEVIKKTFENYCGYDIHYQLLNSRDYGIPQVRERLYCIGFRKKTDFKFPAPIPLKYRMYDFLEDYTETEFYDSESNSKVVTPDSERIHEVAKNGGDRFNEFIFPIKEVDDKYYLSEKVAKYVLAGGTKNFKTSVETDREVARTLLQSMHKMHRAGVDNYVTYKKEKGVNGIRKLTPRECFRLMGFKDDFKIVVPNTSAYMQAGNSIVVDVLIAILKQLDITKYGVNEE
jgi:DNA (cytosine-5)-methyltransferase 1